ncbi:MAG: hypothetical protein AB4041_12715 [Microcystaceae cyanobacterium]
MMTQVAPAQAVTLNFTGAELFNNPNVSFPTTTPVLNGNSIDFGTGGVGGGVLLEVPLLPAIPRGDLTFNIGLDYTALTSDNDLIIGISDGVNLFAVQRFDNSGGGSNRFSGSFSGSGILGNIQGAGTFLTGLNPVNPFSFDLTITSDPLANNFVSNYVEGSASAIGPLNYLPDSFNIDNAQSLVIVRGTGSSGGGAGTNEAYRINSLSVTVQDNPDNPTDIPEASNVLGLFLVGGVILFTGIKFKKKEDFDTEEDT